MAMILAALTLFALVLVMAQIRQPKTAAAYIAALAFAMYLLPGPAKVAAPLAVILMLGLSESIASLKPH
jgi:hypothetical protein